MNKPSNIAQLPSLPMSLEALQASFAQAKLPPTTPARLPPPSRRVNFPPQPKRIFMKSLEIGLPSAPRPTRPSTSYQQPIMNTIIIILAILFVILYKTQQENFFPFNTLRKTLPTPLIINSLPEPYCVNKYGQPVACPLPCQYFCPSCKYDYPVPVFGPYSGAYSANKWCPGPPVC
jgi:hypothetical protein